MPNVLDAALQKLFSAESQDFLETRDALAKELVTKGKRAEAKAVSGHRKPTAAAFLLNRLSRELPGDIQELAAVGKKLRAARTPAQLKDAMEAQRAAVRAATAKATPLLKGLSGGAQLLQRLATHLQAATTAPDRAEALKQGRFTREPEASATFLEQFRGMKAPTPAASTTTRVPKKESAPVEKKAAPAATKPAHAKAVGRNEAARKQAARQQAIRQQAAKAEARAKKDAERREQAKAKQNASEARRADAEVTRLRRERAKAEAHADALERAAEKAVTLAKDARAKIDQVRAQLEAAESKRPRALA